MSIVRYENLTINNVTNGVDSIGEYTTSTSAWFETRGLVHDIANSLRISERYRVYSDLLQITLDRKSTRLNSSHSQQSRMPSSA